MRTSVVPEHIHRQIQSARRSRRRQAIIGLAFLVTAALAIASLPGGDAPLDIRSTEVSGP